MRRAAFQSIEWSLEVARLHIETPSPLPKQRTFYVLPHLPDLVDQQLDDIFHNEVPEERKILTMIASQCTDGMLNFVKDICLDIEETDHLLIVGGNNRGSITTPDAIRYAVQHGNKCKVWATANPNAKSSIDSVHQKIEAGATGFITQPFLTANAMDTFEQYPHKDKITYIAGMALPKTVKSIQFWKKLLSPQVDVEDDSLFQDHVRYFASGKDPNEWAQNQKKTLQTIPGIRGFHYMPMKNMDGLLKIVDKDSHTKMIEKS